MEAITLLQKMLFTSLLLTLALTVSAQNRSGTYYLNNKHIRNDITFREVKRGNTVILNFEISISNVTHPPCLGGLKGRAKWTDANVAEYNRDFTEIDSETGETASCRLTFIFSGSRVIVRENDCGSNHGVSCDFDGTYVRRSKR